MRASRPPDFAPQAAAFMALCHSTRAIKACAVFLTQSMKALVGVLCSSTLRRKTTELAGSSAQEFAAFFKAELVKWGEVAQRAKMRIN